MSYIDLGTSREILHFHLFCGLGGGAVGFNNAHVRIGRTQASFRCLGGVDVDAGAIHDFTSSTGVPGTVLDLFSRQQYTAFWGKEPPKDWREATLADIHRAARYEKPHIVFLSAPCKGFSGLLSERASRSEKYQALNGLTLRGIFMLLEAYANDPVELIVFENVPRIATRGRKLLDRITALLREYGYAVAETVHDCGELGGLTESRKRFLLVARHQTKVPPFLYQPDKRSLRGIGEELARLPVPGSKAVLPMHRVPSLQWDTWVRLAFVHAGKDWRSLANLRVENGLLADYALEPYRPGHLGVTSWDASIGTVAGRAGPTNGAFSVADPRIEGHAKSVQLGVSEWNQPCGVITGQCSAGQGRFSVADPRLSETRFNNVYRIVPWDQPSPTVAGSGGPGGGLAVADPRPAFARGGRQDYASAGHYGVVPWHGTSGAVTAAGQHDNGRWSVADPRIDAAAVLPSSKDRLFAVIRALDGTWHRPLTTLELALVQGLVDPDNVKPFYGSSDSAHRERIGNAVPPPAAQAIAQVMGETLLRAWAGEGFSLSASPIWVQPLAVALSVDQPPAAFAG